MLETLFASTVGESLTLAHTLSVFGMALLLGLFISQVYIKTHKQEGCSSAFAITLIMLPTIIAIIILLVGNNVARAFSLAGAFSLIRFRSDPGDAKDISYIFFTLGVGLACGLGYLAYATLFAVVLCAVMLILDKTNYAKPTGCAMQLKITVPENLNFQSLFDDILSRYTTSWTMKRVKTIDFGALFEIVYSISLKPSVDQKNFLDELKCRNGNLNIALTLKEYEDKIYV